MRRAAKPALLMPGGRAAVSGGPSGRVGLVLGVLSLLVHDVDAVPSAVGRGHAEPEGHHDDNPEDVEGQPDQPEEQATDNTPTITAAGAFLDAAPAQVVRSNEAGRGPNGHCENLRTASLPSDRMWDIRGGAGEGIPPCRHHTRGGHRLSPAGVAAAIALLRQEDDIEATEEDGTLVVKCRCGWFGARRAVLDAERGSCRRCSSLRMAPSLFRGLW